MGEVDDSFKEYVLDSKMLNEQGFVMPGFRFHPTDHELLDFYLRKMVEGKLQPGGFIRSVDFCSHDPWELPGVATTAGVKEYFFFVPRVSKKPHITRPSRVTPSGYWKATGSERTVKMLSGKCLGRRKTLVFYKGRAPKGVRTNWVMQEYRLPEKDTSAVSKESQLEIALCRVYTKASSLGYKACQQKASRQTISEDFSDSAQGHLLCSSENATSFRSNVLPTKEWTEETSTSAASIEHKGKQSVAHSPIQLGSLERAASINAKSAQNHSLRLGSQSEKCKLNSMTRQQTAQEQEGSESFWELCMDESHDLYMSNWDEPFDILGPAIDPESSSSGSHPSYIVDAVVPDLLFTFDEVLHNPLTTPKMSALL